MPGAAMTMWKSVAALMVMAVPVGCAGIPVAVQSLSRAELSDLVTDKTLYVPSVCDTPDGMLLYLAKDGTGWLDSRLMRGDLPRPSEMSIVFEWRVVDGSRVCLSAAPRIGEMPSFMPAFSQCLPVLRSSVPPYNLLTTVTQGGKSCTNRVDLYPYNAFPRSVVDEYLTQVRVLYGGHIPRWTAPEPIQADADPRL